MGPTGRRARWHSKLNKFRIEVIHIAGSTNIISDALSRWAYPACSGYDDVSWHGTEKDMVEMQTAIKKENELERSTPKAQHPMDAEDKEEEVKGDKGTEVKIATVHLEDGTPTTVITMPSGRRLGLAWVSFKESTEMNQIIAAVTRSKAKGSPTKSPEQRQRVQKGSKGKQASNR